MTDSPITPDEARLIAQNNENSVVVGGQALALWADYYQIETPPALVNGITRDLDFLGTKEDAMRMANDLSGKVYVPTLDDHTPNSAVVWIENYNGRDIEIDYLATLQGMDEKKVRERAITLVTPQTDGSEVALKVMHPADLYHSRLSNLHSLPGKRNVQGVAQAELAGMVLHSYLQDTLNDKSQAAQREALNIAEHIGRLATQPEGMYAYQHHGIDPIHTLPVSSYPDKFQTIRFPQLKAYVEARREPLPTPSAGPKLNQ